MSSSEKLENPMRCGLCGAEIPAGTPLSALNWDREERVWRHREPTCTEIGAGELAVQPTAAPETLMSPSERAGTGMAPHLGLANPSNDPAAGPWSVTVEVHEAADPAQSKRVLRIARLRLGTLEEARAAAKRLWTEV
jgi:hypothetical protein